MKKVIIIPGLGDKVRWTEIAIRNWRKYGIEPIIYSMNWHDGESFKIKLNTLTEFVDNLSKNDSKISVVGCSAGASAALNLFLKCPNNVERAVSVCGRLREGNQTGFRSLETRSRKSLAIKESVKLFESQEGNLSDEQRKNIMTVRSLFGDELVPSSTSSIKGVENITVPMIEHTLSIYLALSLFSKKSLIS